MAWKRVLRAVIALAGVVGGLCHGFLATPAARNVQHNSNYCPQCLNGPEVCGDPAGQHHHEAFGKFGTSRTVAKYSPGGRLTARVVFTANHKGRWSLGLCALRDPSPTGERAAMKRRCFKNLKLATGGGAFVYLSPSATTSSATFRLPRIRCRRCVLRWFYETGNSCTPKGTPPAYASPGLGTCSASPWAETFANCADIRIG